MTDVVQQRAQKHNDWWMALAARINSDLPGALATIEGDGQAMIEEIRAAGGYPWQRTFDTVLRVYGAPKNESPHEIHPHSRILRSL